MSEKKKISKGTLFVIEVSSYQLAYSQLFKSQYSVILNISADHLERHGNLKKYISAKFRLLENQNKDSIVFLIKMISILKRKLNQKKNMILQKY